MLARYMMETDFTFKCSICGKEHKEKWAVGKYQNVPIPILPKGWTSIYESGSIEKDTIICDDHEYKIEIKDKEKEPGRIISTIDTSEAMSDEERYRW